MLLLVNMYIFFILIISHVKLRSITMTHDRFAPPCIMQYTIDNLGSILNLFYFEPEFYLFFLVDFLLFLLILYLKYRNESLFIYLFFMLSFSISISSSKRDFLLFFSCLIKIHTPKTAPITAPTISTIKSVIVSVNGSNIEDP